MPTRRLIIVAQLFAQMYLESQALRITDPVVEEKYPDLHIMLHELLTTSQELPAARVFSISMMDRSAVRVFILPIQIKQDQ